MSDTDFPRGRELAAKVVEHLDAHPGDFDGGNWHLCFAGWTCTLGGREWLSDERGRIDFERLVARDDDPADVVYELPVRHARPALVASELLGIDRHAASDTLWYKDLTAGLAWLRAYANGIV